MAALHKRRSDCLCRSLFKVMTQDRTYLLPRIEWLEGIRIFAAVMILLYHAQLLITDYVYTPQPTGLIKNLNLIGSANQHLSHFPLASILLSPIWFGFQFVDVFVLISGFSLVLSLKGKPLKTIEFLQKRFFRILLPFWTVAWLSYPVLWLIGKLNHSYIPNLWNVFAAATFPLLFDFEGKLLLFVSGPWWFVSLILSFTLVFPFLWNLLQRWGASNLLIVSLLLTVAYRAIAVFQFGGHPTYVSLETPAGWAPFVPFLSKLSTFVIGMVVAQAYLRGRGPLFWKPQTALKIGIPLYVAGFVCQFYWSGWVIADLLLPLGLALISMVAFQTLAAVLPTKSLMLQLGMHSYSYFLIHNFVVDRVINLWVRQSLPRYYLSLPMMLLATLALAYLADYLAPKLQQLVKLLFETLDNLLAKNSASRFPPKNTGYYTTYRGEESFMRQAREEVGTKR